MMRLTDPTDFEVLEALEDGRNVASNIAIEIERDRAYINTRLPHLADHGLVDRIGPAEKSGLYELTPRGEAVISHRPEYAELDSQAFERLIDTAL